RLPLIELATYVKLDIRALAPAKFREHLSLLKKLGVSVIAEKVESDEEFRRCHDWGCDLFQGHYLRRPEILTGKRIPFNRLSVLALLAKSREGDYSETARVISRDSALVYAMLRLANSALYGRRNEIRSLSQAMAMLGIDRVFRWATL